MKFSAQEKKSQRPRERDTERDRDQHSLHQNMEVIENLVSYFRSHGFEQLKRYNYFTLKRISLSVQTFVQDCHYTE